MLNHLRLKKNSREEVLKSLPGHKTLGNVLQSLREILSTETSLCEHVIDILLEQPSITALDLKAETRRALHHRVKEHRQNPPAATAPPPPTPMMRAGLPAVGRFEELSSTVEEACAASSPAPSVVEPRAEFKKSHSAATLSTLSSKTWSGTLPIVPLDPGSFRKRLFLIFEDADSSILSKAFATLILLTIVVSTISFVVESSPAYRERPAACFERIERGLKPTVEDCEPRPLESFFGVEAVCIAIFTIDYVARISLAHSVREENCNVLRATVLYALQPLAVIDLLAIIPFYLDLYLNGAFGFAAVLRLARTFRLLKLAGKFPMVNMYTEVLRMSGQPLLILMFFNAIVIVIFGALIYYAEGQSFSVDEVVTSMPKYPTGAYIRDTDETETGIEVTPFRSIPYALWWVCVTVTTVGYGDYTPTTPLGKFIGVATFYCGIIFLALPISILGQNFSIVYDRFLKKNRSQFPSFHRSGTQQSLLTDGTTRTHLRPSLLRAVTTRSTSWLPKNQNRRQQIFRLLEDPTSSRIAQYFSVVMIFTIVVSTASFIMESMDAFRETPKDCDPAHPTVEDCEPRPWAVFQTIEVVCIVIFTLDYTLRMLTVHAADALDCGLVETTPMSGRTLTIAYGKQLLNLIDLFAIIPFYIELIGGIGGGSSVLRVLRLVRIFRVLKVPKMKSCAEMFLDVGLDAAPALFILLLMSMLACIFFASCIYFSEGTSYSVDEQFLEAHPYGVYVRPTADGHSLQVSPFKSIPYSFWWFFTTATTVGYGDDYPTTTAGRLVAIFVFATGVVLLAMPITIVGGSFGKYYEDWVRCISDLSMSMTLGSLPDSAPTRERSNNTLRVTASDRTVFSGGSDVNGLKATPELAEDDSDGEMHLAAYVRGVSPLRNTEQVEQEHRFAGLFADLDNSFSGADRLRENEPASAKDCSSYHLNSSISTSDGHDLAGHNCRRSASHDRLVEKLASTLTSVSDYSVGPAMPGMPGSLSLPRSQGASRAPSNRTLLPEMAPVSLPPHPHAAPTSDCGGSVGGRSVESPAGSKCSPSIYQFSRGDDDDDDDDQGSEASIASADTRKSKRPIPPILMLDSTPLNSPGSGSPTADRDRGRIDHFGHIK